MEVGSLDLGILLLRLGIATMWLGWHAVPKLLHFSQRSEDFPDPLRLGSRSTLFLVALIELVGGAAIALGFFTRTAAAASIAICIGAELSVRGNQPRRVSGVLLYPKETARLYFCSYAVILLGGPGGYSLDYLLHSI